MKKIENMIERFEKSPKTLAFWLWIGQVASDRDYYISTKYPEETEDIQIFLSRCLDLKQTTLIHPDKELDTEEQYLLNELEFFVNNMSCDIEDIYQIYMNYKNIFNGKTRNLICWIG